MNGINELSPRGRCFTCGRFIKRGLFNYIRHLDKCPERQIMIFSLKPINCKLIKLKYYHE